MADETFPVLGGKRIQSADLRRLFKDYPALADVVLSGFTVSAGAGLTLNIALGTMVVNGTFVGADAKTRALTDNATNHVFVGYDPAVKDTILVTHNTTGASPGVNYQKIAEVPTAAGVIGAPVDKRQLRTKFTRDVEAASDLLVYGSHGANVADTEGFLALPTMSGTPTGTPAIGAGAVVYDVTNKEFKVWDGAAWQTVGRSWGNP